MTAKQVHIYVLKDPRDGVVRYVGKTENTPRKRLSRHLHDSQHCNSHKDLWVMKLLREGVTPIIESIELCSLENWPERECFWIKKYRDDGFDLTNTSPGGLGGDGDFLRSLWTPELRVKFSEKMKAVTSTKKERSARKVRSRAMWQDPEYRAKMILPNGSMAQFTEESFARRSATMKKKLTDPKIQKEYSKRAKKMWADPNHKKKTKEAMVRSLETPEARQRKREASLRNWSNPEYIEAQRIAREGRCRQRKEA